MQLEKWDLAKEDDELSIGVMPVGPYLFFGDSSGDNQLIVSEDYASRCLNQIAFRMGKLTREEFWSGKWLGDLMRYRNLEKLWVGIRADPLCPSRFLGLLKPWASAEQNGSAVTGGFSSPRAANMALWPQRIR